MDDDDRTPEQQEFLDAFEAMPEEIQTAMRRVMDYLATNPEDGPKTQEEMNALLEKFKRLN